jgi:DNA-binding NarL/FixJ family response regulator
MVVAVPYPSGMPIRVVLADDHPIVLQGLQALFERHADMVVVDACTNGSSALAAARSLGPDVLVVDLRMSDGGGLEVLRTVAAEQLTCRCVLLTGAISDQEIVEAVKLGLAGLVLKDSAPETLVDCVRRVHDGKQAIDRDTLLRAFRNVLDGDGDGGERGVAAALTQRELDIVRMIAEGLRNKVIADRLGIAEGTVKVHLHNIYEKLHVEGRMELLLAAQQRGLL